MYSVLLSNRLHTFVSIRKVFFAGFFQKRNITEKIVAPLINNFAGSVCAAQSLVISRATIVAVVVRCLFFATYFLATYQVYLSQNCWCFFLFLYHSYMLLQSIMVSFSLWLFGTLALLPMLETT